MVAFKHEARLEAPLLFMLGKMFQNLRVSSPAPVTIFEPHGLIERYRTR